MANAIRHFGVDEARMRADVRAADGKKLDGELVLVNRRGSSAQGEKEFLILGEEAVLGLKLRPAKGNQSGTNEEEHALESMKQSLFYVNMNPVPDEEQNQAFAEERGDDGSGCEPVDYDRGPTDHTHAAGLAKQLLSVEEQRDGSLLAKVSFLVLPNKERRMKKTGSTFWLNVVQCQPAARSETSYSTPHTLEEKETSKAWDVGNGRNVPSESYKSHDGITEDKVSSSMEKVMSSMGRSFVSGGRKKFLPVRFWQTKVQVYKPLSIQSTQLEIQLETVVALKVRNTLPSYLGAAGVIDLSDARFEHEPENPSILPLQIAAIPLHQAGATLPTLRPGEEYSLAYKPVVVNDNTATTFEQEGKYFAVVTCGSFKYHDDFIYRQVLGWRPRVMQGIVLNARAVGLADTNLGVPQAKPVSVALQVTNLSKQDIDIELLFATPTENDNPCKSLLWLQSKRQLGKVAREDASFALVEMLPLHEGTINLEGIRLKDLVNGTLYLPETVPQLFIKTSK